MDMRFALGLPCLVTLLLLQRTETCHMRIENANCSSKELSSLHYTCTTTSRDGNCLCEFEHPLRSELGWYKICKQKNDLKVGKKRVRKRQISTFLFDNCRTVEPPRPGKVSCTVSMGEITCLGRCSRGYKFPGDVRDQIRSCRYLEGIWKPTNVFSPCEPECPSPCLNGGNCTFPNFCRCTNEFRGETCQYALDLCGFTKNYLASFWRCNHTNTETSCDISCNAPGTIKAITEAKRYICNVEGLWSTPLPPCVQVINICDDPGDIKFGNRSTRAFKYLLGSSVSYDCNEGYDMSGDSKITCQSDGLWSSDKPRCIREVTIPSRSTPEAAQCPRPTLPKNSAVIIRFPNQKPFPGLFDAELGFLDRLYFTLKASSSDANFSRVPEEIFRTGTRIQYKCRSRFYKLYGSEYQTCLPSHSWSGYQPACIPECGHSDSPKKPFVVNGDASQVGQWPWMVGLAMKSSRGLQLTCGGVLIAETWVLTAAHCVTKIFSNIPVEPKDFLVFCGKHFRKFEKDDEYIQVKAVKQIIVHEEYDFIHYDADIALLQLENAIELTSRVQPICLPNDQTTRENVRDERKGIVLGWGLTENGTFSDTLRETVLPVVNHDRCEEAYQKGLRSVTITRNMFCAGHKEGNSDTCIGDSGGPFMFSMGPSSDKRWYLEGLVSWGSETGCAKANQYSGFTKVGRFVPWIKTFI